jgi:hypothetical protein
LRLLIPILLLVGLCGDAYVFWYALRRARSSPGRGWGDYPLRLRSILLFSTSCIFLGAIVEVNR